MPSKLAKRRKRRPSRARSNTRSSHPPRVWSIPGFGLLRSKWPLLCVIFIATLVVFNQKIGMSFDRGLDYVYIATQPVDKILAQDVKDQPPLYFLFMKAWMSVFGSSEISIRFLLYLFYVGLIVLTYIVSLEVFRSEFVALLSSLLVCLNPLVVWFTFDPKYWMVFAFMGLLTIHLYIRYRENPSIWSQVFWGVSAGILPATCLEGFGFLLAFGVYAFLLIILRKLPIRRAIVPFLLMLILSLPIIYTLGAAQEYLVTDQKPKEGDISLVGSAFLKDVFNHILYVERYYLQGRSVFLYFIVAAALLGVLLNRRNGYARFLVLLSVILLVGGYYASQETMVRNRYFIPLVPILFMFSADFISRIPYRRLVLTLTFGTVAFYGVFFFQFMSGLYFPDWHAGAEIVNAQATPYDTIISVKGDFNKAFQEVYLGKNILKYEHLEDLKMPSGRNVLLIHEDSDWPTKLEGLKSQYVFNRTWVLDGVYVHRLTRREDWLRPLSSWFGSAKVNILDGRGLSLDCDLNPSTPACFAEDWQKVSVKDVKIGGLQRTCVFAHPRNNETVEVVFPSLDVLRSLVLYAGYEDGYASPHMSQSYIDVLQGGEKVDTIIVPNMGGYMRYVLDTSGYSGRRGLTFRVYTDDDKMRHLCFDAVAQDEPVDLPDDFFWRRIDEAKVSLVNADGSPVPCGIWRNDSVYPNNAVRQPFTEGKLFSRWDCKPNTVQGNVVWDTFAQGFDSSGGVFEKALWAHPHVNQTLRVEYDGVPLSGKLSGIYGINDLAFTNMPEQNIRFSVLVDGTKVYSDVIDRHQGWLRFNIAGDTLQGSRDVVFEVSVDGDSNSWAHFYYNAYR